MTATVEISEIQDKAIFESLKDEWNDLVENDRQATVFQTWEFQFHSWKIFEDDIRLCLLLVRSESGQLIGCAPLGSRVWGRWPASVRILGFCSEKFSDYCDFIVDCDYSADVLTALAGWINENSSQWDVICLGSLLDTAWVKNDAHFLSQCHLPYRSRQVSIAPYLHFEPNWSSYEDVVSKKRRASLRYKVRKLFRNFDGRYREESEQTMTHALGQLMDLHQKRMQQKNQTGHFGRLHARKIFSELIEKLAQRGIAKIHSIRSDDATIASICTFEYRGSVSFYQGGMEPEYNKLSPGLVIHSLRINDALESGAAEYDFLDGDEPYKAVWANKKKSIFEVEFGTNSWRHAVYRLRNKLRQRLAQSDNLRAIYFWFSTMKSSRR